MHTTLTFSVPVTQTRLQHYLRTHRRRHGFSQSEMAQLLGTSSGGKVSRYESFRRQPSVATTFAYEIIFNTPVGELFAGAYDSVRCDVRARALRLIKSLEPYARNPRTARKLLLLRIIVESKSMPSGRI